MEKTMQHEMVAGNIEWLTGIVLAIGTTRVYQGTSKSGTLRVDIGNPFLFSRVPNIFLDRDPNLLDIKY